MHDICVLKVQNNIPYLPYFESIKSEGLRNTRNSKSIGKLLGANCSGAFKSHKRYRMDFGDSIMIRGQTGKSIDVPRLIFSAYRTENPSRELQTKLIDVYRHIDAIISNIITDHTRQVNKEEGGTGNSRGWGALFGKIKALFIQCYIFIADELYQFFS